MKRARFTPFAMPVPRDTAYDAVPLGKALGYVADSFCSVGATL